MRPITISIKTYTFDYATCSTGIHVTKIEVEARKWIERDKGIEYTDSSRVLHFHTWNEITHISQKPKEN
jgi:hypothetical protein